MATPPPVSLQVPWTVAESALLPVNQAARERWAEIRDAVVDADGKVPEGLLKSADQCLIREGELFSAQEKAVLYVVLLSKHVLLTMRDADGRLHVDNVISLAGATLNLAADTSAWQFRFQVWGADNVYTKLDALPPTSKVMASWVRDLQILILQQSPAPAGEIGWQHRRIIGTLHSAALHGDNDFIKHHFHKKQDSAVESSINLRDSDGFAPIHLACIAGYLSTVALLAEEKADMTALTASCDSLLQLAVRHGHTSIVAHLLYKADVNPNTATRSDACSPLHEACLSRNTEIIQLLLHKGAWPNAVNACGDTPLKLLVTGKEERPLLRTCMQLLRFGACAELDDYDAESSFLLQAFPAENERRLLRVARDVFINQEDFDVREEEDASVRLVRPAEWEPDSASPCCRLCGDVFWWFFNGRHHCRVCGVLVCQECSSKMITFVDANESLKQPPPPRRVCDGCFNRVTVRIEQSRRLQLSDTEVPPLRVLTLEKLV